MKNGRLLYNNNIISIEKTRVFLEAVLYNIIVTRPHSTLGLRQ